MDRSEVLKMGRGGCSVEAALDVLGERWTFLVLREAFFGLRRFDDFQKKTGAARNLLTDRLATLVKSEVLTKVPYREDGQRERFEYRLTPRARSCTRSCKRSGSGAIAGCTTAKGRSRCSTASAAGAW